MGLKDKMLKKAREIEERRPQFTPLELNEGNVQAIFNRCIATEETTDYVESIAHFFEVLHCPLSSPISSKIPKPDYDSKSWSLLGSSLTGIP